VGVLEALILSIVQGITELLPISSSGHLIIFAEILKIEPEVSLLTMLHLASGFAILLAYHKKILSLLKSKDILSIGRNFLVAVIPIIVVGIVIGDEIEEYLYNSIFIAINLIFWGILMILIEIYEKRVKYSIDEVENVTFKQSLIIGFAQVLALLPGTSRSGITTITGIATGIKKSTALDFSFIIGIPLLFGAFTYEFLKEYESIIGDFSSTHLLAFIATFLVSYLAVEVLKRISKYRFLTFFGFYRIIIGILILLLL
jgi:undecaprenyl-diphosphatase